MYFVRPTSSSSSSKAGGSGASGGGGGPASRNDGPSAAERQAEREKSGPVADALNATASIRLVDDEGNVLSRQAGKIIFSDGREVDFTSGADGRYFVAGLEPDTTYEVVVDPPENDGE